MEDKNQQKKPETLKPKRHISNNIYDELDGGHHHHGGHGGSSYQYGYQQTSKKR